MATVTTETKKWYQSKTLIAGVVTILGAGVTAWMTKPDLKLAAIAAIGALMVFLRTQTSLPLGK